MCLQNQNVHIQLEESRRFQSIKYQFTPDPSPFHRITYLRGKIHIALLLCQTKTLQRKTTLSEVPIQEVVLPPAVITVYIYLSIYRRVCGEYIYCHAEESCREESLSMLVQHGKPPSPSGFSSKYRMLGGPRLLGLSLDQGSYRNRH